MPLKPHPNDPDKMVYVSRQYDIPQPQGIPQLQGVTTAQPAQEPWPEEPFGHMAGGVQPPQRPWVDLTRDDILDLFDEHNVYGSKWIEFARAVLAKSKERNT